MASSITQQIELNGTAGVTTRSQRQKQLSESAAPTSSNGTAAAANDMGMVNGKRVRPTKAFTTKEEEWKSVVPQEVPSIIELKRILPAHCFTPSLVTAYYYVAKDFAIIAALYTAMMFVESSNSMPSFVQYAVTPLYWYLQVWVAFEV